MLGGRRHVAPKHTDNLPNHWPPASTPSAPHWSLYIHLGGVSSAFHPPFRQTATTILPLHQPPFNYIGTIPQIRQPLSSQKYIKPNLRKNAGPPRGIPRRARSPPPARHAARRLRRRRRDPPVPRRRRQPLAERAGERRYGRLRLVHGPALSPRGRARGERRKRPHDLEGQAVRWLELPAHRRPRAGRRYRGLRGSESVAAARVRGVVAGRVAAAAAGRRIRGAGAFTSFDQLYERDDEHQPRRTPARASSTTRQRAARAAGAGPRAGAVVLRRLGRSLSRAAAGGQRGGRRRRCGPGEGEDDDRAAEGAGRGQERGGAGGGWADGSTAERGAGGAGVGSPGHDMRLRGAFLRARLVWPLTFYYR